MDALVIRHGRILRKPINETYAVVYVPSENKFVLQEGRIGTIAYHWFTPKEWEKITSFKKP